MMHRATAASHRAPRKGRRRATVITLTLAILGVAAVAFAAVLATAPVQGNVSGSEFAVKWQGDLTVVGSEHAICTAQVHKITVGQALPGGYCRFRGKVEDVGGSGNPKVQGIDLGLPKGWDVEMTSGCGERIGTMMSPATVEWTVTRSSEDAASASIPEGVGLTAVPSTDFQESACN